MSEQAGIKNIEFSTLRIAWETENIQSSTAGLGEIEFKTPKMARDAK